MPELLTLIKGIKSATRSVSCTLVLLIGFLYIFAIIFTQTLSKIDDNSEACQNVQGYYADLGLSMLMLFLAGTLLDNVVDVMWDMKLCPASYYHIYIFGLFILLSSFTVLNMLIGVLCEVVSETSAREAESAMVSEIREEITAVFLEIDVNGDGTVSKDEFEQMKKNPIVIGALDKVGVKPKHFFALADVLFEPSEPATEAAQKELEMHAEEEHLTPTAGGHGSRQEVPGVKTKATSSGEASIELEFDEFLEMVISQRPEKNASVMDTALLRQMFRTMISRVDGRITHNGQPAY